MALQSNRLFFSIIVFVVICLSKRCESSAGDRSQIFNECVDKCRSFNCTSASGGGGKSQHELTQSIYLSALGWTCLDECKYMCMWHTVDKFVRVYKHDVPQFYGKWPFIRMLGIQEPASVVASLLNLIANLYMIEKMHRKIQAKRRTPFKLLWYSFSIVCINTWIWSTIFHTRDLWLTELMDYFSAFLLVLFQFNVFFIRVLWPRRRSLMLALNATSLVYYLYHCYYLSMINFDYGYNMKVNILIGLANSVCWILWSCHLYFRYRISYMWRCAFSFLLFDVLMVLEIFDFSPIWWTFDSHALWHFSTISIPFYWFRFIIDDISYMQLDWDYEKFS